MADQLGCSVEVHTTNPPGNKDELANLLEPAVSSLICIRVQDNGSHIIDATGEVQLAICEARNREVIFDTTDGRVHYAYSVAKAGAWIRTRR